MKLQVLTAILIRLMGLSESIKLFFLKLMPVLLIWVEISFSGAMFLQKYKKSLRGD